MRLQQSHNIDVPMLKAKLAEFFIPSTTLEVITSEMCRLRIPTFKAAWVVRDIKTLGYAVTSQHERWHGDVELYFHVNGVQS